VLQFDIISGVVTTVYNAVKGLYDMIKSVIDAGAKIADIGGGVVGGVTGGLKKAGGFLGGLIPLATGGIVTGPTPALVGEAGPEAVIPLDKIGSLGGTMNITVNMPAGSNGADIVSAIEREGRRRGTLPIRSTQSVKL